MTENCDNCGNEFTQEMPSHELCPSCAEERAMSRLSNIEAPEGGWPRGSDMDRI